MSKDKENRQELGKAGEIHQTTNEGYETMTTMNGVPVSDDQNTLGVGPSGAILMEDFKFREKIFHFDHERIPERVVHARGLGAHGFFETTKAIPELTRADIFQRVGEKTPVFVRFSDVIGSKGSSDVIRDVRGFAVKFYTKQGNWDLVGNNIPVFFIQDPIKFPDLIHAAKPAPDRDFPQGQTAHDNFWDYISFTPEAMHMIMWIMSDRGIPRSFRFMEGFGVHTFRLVNHEGKSHFVKFHWKPKLGLQSVMWDEAMKLNGVDPDYFRRDMWDSIKAGNFPEWELGIQVFDEKFANDFYFDVLDSTKLIPEELCPVQIIGRMVLNRMPDNFFLETEQVAFCTQNIVDGIDFTDDPLLQGRNFSYLDTQIKRLGGPNFTHLPINAPKCPFHNFMQDGHMAMHNPKGRANYEPNGWGTKEGGPRENPNIGFKTYKAHINGQKLRERKPTFGDHYSQARQFYISQTPIEQQHIIDALVFELSKCEEARVQKKIIGRLVNIDKDLATKVSMLVLGDTSYDHEPAFMPPKTDLPPSDALSILKNPPKEFKGRKIGVFVGKEIDKSVIDYIEELKKTAQELDSFVEVIVTQAPHFVDKSGKQVKSDMKCYAVSTKPSVLYDAVIVILSDNNKDEVINNPYIRNFVNDAYSHCKFIGYNKESKWFFDAMNLTIDGGCIALDENAPKEFIAKCKKLRFWDRKLIKY